MKRIIIFFLTLIVNVSIMEAVEVTLTSSVYADTINSSVSYSSPSQQVTGNLRRIHFLNKISSLTGMETAIDEADRIFSNAMKQNMNVDLTDMTVCLTWGDASTFSEISEVCKVKIFYTDDVIDNPIYPHLTEASDYSYLPVIYPRALSNQSYSLNQDTAMIIMLNPQISNYLYYGIGECPDSLYDLTTILLRGLAIGCGLQSTFQQDGPYTAGITINNLKYINSFDFVLRNDMNYSYQDMALSYISPSEFLDNRSIYVSDFYGNPIEIYNNRKSESTNPISSSTLNSISRDNYTENEIEEGFCDIVGEFLLSGSANRYVTHYTLSILRTLGWLKDYLTDGESEYSNLYNSHLQCSDSILMPNTIYDISMSANSVNVGDIVCELESKDSVYQIGIPNNNLKTFSYSSIPNNVKWRRNQINHHIIGHIKTEAFMFIDEMVCQNKICDIFIPYRPDRPEVTYSEQNNNGDVYLSLKIFANGSETYTINYEGLTNHDSHSITLNSNAIDTILIIPGGQLYNMTIYGSNAIGNSSSYMFNFGSSALPPITISTLVLGNTLRYFVNGVTNPVISSVYISKVPDGTIVLTPNVGPNTAINISTLSHGYYLITVVIDNQSYSRIFAK